MSIRSRSVALALSLVLGLAAFGARSGHAAGPETVLALAGPLAERYGVSGSAVTEMLQNGVSLETVAQLLLPKEGSGKSLDRVTDVFDETEGDVDATAEELGVAAETYSDENVQAAIDRARGDTAGSAADGADGARKETGKSVDSLLGGMKKGE